MLLFVAFGAMIAAGIPLLLALAGIAVGFAVLHMLSWVTPMSVWSMNFSMMIGLAVGIDYSLFIVSRYREERAEGKDAIAAIENTMSTAGKAVFLSALTVVLSLAAVFLVPVMVFRSMALGMILSVVAVALAALTLLPAVLVALGDKVLVTRGKKDPDIVAESRWARWTGVALRRPGAVLAIGLGGPRRARAAGARHAPRHAGRAGRRPRPHQPRRLRARREGLRAGRGRACVHHRPRRRREHRGQGGRGRSRRGRRRVS